MWLDGENVQRSSLGKNCSALSPELPVPAENTSASSSQQEKQGWLPLADSWLKFKATFAISVSQRQQGTCEILRRGGSGLHCPGQSY